jgi:hypothetical protein
MLYTDAVLVATRVAEQTGNPQFVVGRGEQWAVGHFQLKPIDGFTVQKVEAPRGWPAQGVKSRIRMNWI